MTPDEVAALLKRHTISPEELHRSGILPAGRNLIYDSIRRGEIATISIGKKKAIIVSALRKQLGMDA